MNFLGVNVGKPYEVVVTGLFWAGVGYVGWQVYKGLDPAGAEKFDITSEKNFVNAAFTDLYQKVTGSKQMLGADIYDWLHPDEVIKPVVNETGNLIEKPIGPVKWWQ